MRTSGHLPDLGALALLVAVSRFGSIGAAARAEGVSQQTASERLAAVERQIGMPLLKRGARGTTLTRSGTVLVEWSARLLEAADEVDAAIAALRTERDREFRVHASMTIAEHLLPRWLVAFGRRPSGGHTSVSLTASNSRDVLVAVSTGTADVGFVEGSEVPHDLAVRDIGIDELVLVASPTDPLARRRRALGPEQVARLALTSREPGSGTREVVDRALAEHGLTVSAPAVELTTATGVRESVRAGGAPAFLSRRTVDQDVAGGVLVLVPTTGLSLTRVLRAVWVGGPTPPAGPVRDLLAIASRPIS